MSDEDYSYFWRRIYHETGSSRGAVLGFGTKRVALVNYYIGNRSNPSTKMGLQILTDDGKNVEQGFNIVAIRGEVAWENSSGDLLGTDDLLKLYPDDFIEFFLMIDSLRQSGEQFAAEEGRFECSKYAGGRKNNNWV